MNKPFPTYKPTSHPVLGDIPTDWSETKLAYTFVKANAGEVIDKSFWGDGKELLYTCNRTPLRSDYERFATGKRTTDNDLLLTRNGTPYVHKPEAWAIYSNVVQRITLSSEYSRDYLTYCLGNSALGMRGYGVSIESFNFDNWKSLRFAHPSLNEQKQIAAFLDYETAKIDALIEKQQQLIALLGEKRQAVISQAITKGLNADAPMRDSGIEMLGEVPEHWDVRAISKCITKITNGFVGPTRDILVEEGVPYIQATHIKNGVVNFDNAYFVRQEWSDRKSKSILKEGDVLIVQTGAGTGDVGLVSEKEEGYNCHALIILTSAGNSMTGSYLALALQSEYGNAVLFSIRTGGMHPHLNCGEVKFVRVPVPPLSEQVAIAKYVKGTTETFGVLEGKAEAAVELLQERRTALISAAVTGKIDVRGWKPPSSIAKQETEMEVA